MVRKPARIAYGIFAVLLLALNGVLLAFAAEDRSWGAFGIAIAIGPIANGVLAVLALLFTPWMRHRGVSWWLHALVSLGVPAAAIVADFVLIGTMDLHGC